MKFISHRNISLFCYSSNMATAKTHANLTVSQQEQLGRLSQDQLPEHISDYWLENRECGVGF